METVSGWNAPATLHWFFVRLQTDRLVVLLETPPFIHTRRHNKNFTFDDLLSFRVGAQMDRLVGLLETPPFTFLRLHLLQPGSHPALLQCAFLACI